MLVSITISTQLGAHMMLTHFSCLLHIVKTLPLSRYAYLIWTIVFAYYQPYLKAEFKKLNKYITPLASKFDL